ncbi:uncharacterized protein LOC121381796 [Gigantopelta aegis]|uniref:uncharacterized protein LOC121381796 n=1 Tax=Gigantopelta aegis TaxID=1735272 RepID=UPI001B8893FC|nr:uncharacterized protein LOC121381796 [Gigantopelta aegis]
MASKHSSNSSQSHGQSERARCQLELGSDVYLVAKPWHQKLLIHIRRFENYKGKTFPTKGGITINLKHWVELCGCKSQIDETISASKQGKDETFFRHLGANVHTSMDQNFAGVDLRQWWWCDETKFVKLSKKGISLSTSVGETERQFGNYERLCSGTELCYTFCHAG